MRPRLAYSQISNETDTENYFSYLVTTFKPVPRGTEGAVSFEGTLSGLFASIILAFMGCLVGEVW